MTLNRWDPFRDLLDFHEKMNRVMDAACRPALQRRRAHWTPIVDLIETPDAYIVRADLPGVGRDNISIEMRGNRLIIQGEREAEPEPGSAAYHHIERETGIFQRIIPIPGTVDLERAEARYADGVLDLNLPKSQRPQTRSVEVIRVS